MKKIVLELINADEQVMKLQFDNPKEDLPPSLVSEASDNIINAGVFNIKNKPATELKNAYTIEEIVDIII